MCDEFLQEMASNKKYYSLSVKQKRIEFMKLFDNMGEEDITVFFATPHRLKLMEKIMDIELVKLPDKLPFPDPQKAYNKIETYKFDKKGNMVSGWRTEYQQLYNYEPWRNALLELVEKLKDNKDFKEMTNNAIRDEKLSKEVAQLHVAENGLDYFAEEWLSIISSNSKARRGNRPSPRVSATSVPIGTIMEGGDGEMWEVRASGLSQRWFKVKGKNATITIPKKSHSDCDLERRCPEGYTKPEVVEIAKDCGIDPKGKTLKQLCAEIKMITRTEHHDRLYDVDADGVMLAKEYMNKKTGKPTVKNVEGWLASEKFDGVRAIWDGTNFVSRTGVIYEAPQWFKDKMPDAALDGELFIDREKFQETTSVVRKKVPVDSEWKKITYQVFDAPAFNGGAEERVEEYTRVVKDVGFKPLVAVKQRTLKSEQDMEKFYESILSKGGEGIMLRKPGSPYVGKRSGDLLKYKPFFDAEAKIVGYESGGGKYSGMLGAFKVEDVKSKKKFKVGSGLTDKIRGDYKKTHPIGTIITYAYTGTTDDGVPRHPRYVRIRKE